ncbi:MULTISPECIES: cytochrome P450 [Streptomyces]|uniref:Cytochrome P450 n=1 Tax=Streptomyces lonegramiae TaxID=3075524 RepID=A0ABU2XND5_9ACTN|nr:cytochrome P450 [Streptomyces sp. DSM 41529]MDT0547347.1 cytochrome P450 [Streptomyces sp. DSM 41529]
MNVVEELPDDCTTLDLTDPRTFQRYDRNEMWRRLRAERPVFWHPPGSGRPGFWVLTRHADIMEVYRDNRRFTSERGNVLTTLLAGGDSAAGKMLAVTDGARHKRLRNVMLRVFSPRFLESVEQRVREMARRLLGGAVEQGGCDFARDVAEKIPMGTICYLLGIPESDQDLLLKLTKSALSSDHENASESSAVWARNEILLYFLDLLDGVRKNPREGIISGLANGREDEGKLSDEEIVFNCYSLIIGGDETSRMSMIGAIPALAEHPAQWALLRSGEVGVDTAAEEVLRWTTPAMHFGRTAVEEVTIGSHTVRPGEIVTLWNSSANRDERVFADPDRFLLARTPNRHLTFGYGPHFCIGAYLGRAEVAAVLDALRSRVVDLAVTSEPRRVHSNFLDGISSLPVSFTAG